MRLFVSFASEDRHRARQLAETLRGLGHDVFIDEVLRSGDLYRTRLEEEISRADRVLVLWTKASVESSWVLEEAEAARKAGKLLPIRFGVDPPFGFREVHAPNFALLTSAAGVVSALGLGDLGKPPQPRKKTSSASSPDEWSVGQRGFISWITRWATGDR